MFDQERFERDEAGDIKSAHAEPEEFRKIDEQIRVLTMQKIIFVTLAVIYFGSKKASLHDDEI